MSEESTPENPPICPSCGEPVEDDAPAGLCPRCVLGAAANPTGNGDETIPHPRFDAPDIDEIASAFFVPDESVREEMFAQLAQFKKKTGPTVLIPDIRRLDLFQVEVNKVKYRAMLEIDILAK